MSTFEASRGKSKVQAPAITMIVVGALYCLGGLWGLWEGLNFRPPNQAELAKSKEEFNKGLESNPQAKKEDVEMVKGIYTYMEMLLVSGGTVSIVWGLAALALGAFMIFGAVQMMQLRSFGMAMTASFAALVPCVSFCCVLGIPVGIWSLIVLNNPDVKMAFREAQEGAV